MKLKCFLAMIGEIKISQAIQKMLIFKRAFTLWRLLLRFGCKPNAPEITLAFVMFFHSLALAELQVTHQK